VCMRACMRARVCVCARVSPASRLEYLNLMEFFEDFIVTFCSNEDTKIHNQFLRCVESKTERDVCTEADGACHSLLSVSLFSRGKHWNTLEVPLRGV
jgi:hypothetical protein